jgi:O-antigen/teichoic acid export membrane protein
MKKTSLFNKSNDPSKLSSENKLKFLFKDTYFFGGLFALSMIFPFITLPFLTKYFSVEDFGLYDSLIVLSGFLSLFFIFGQDSSLARWFYEVKDKNAKIQVISQSLLIQLLFSSFFITLLIIFVEKVSFFYLNESAFDDLIVLIVIYSFFLLVNNFTINILKWSYERKYYAILSMTTALLIFFSFIIVYIFKLSLFEFLLMNNIAMLISIIIGFNFTKKWLTLNIDYKYIKELLYYGIPVGIIASASALSPLIDRKMILSFLDFKSMGIYGLAFKIATIVVMLNSIFHMAWGPFSMSIFKQEDAEKIFNVVFKLQFLGLACIVLLLSFISPFLINTLFKSEYSEAINLILPLSFSIMFNGLSYVSGIGIELSLKSYLNLIPFVFSTLLLIVMLYYTIPVFKLYGVAYSFLIVSFFKFIIQSYIARKVYLRIKINFELIIIFSILIFVNLFVLFNYNYSLVYVIFQFILLLVLLFYCFLNSKERAFLRNRIMA